MCPASWPLPQRGPWGPPGAPNSKPPPCLPPSLPIFPPSPPRAKLAQSSPKAGPRLAQGSLKDRSRPAPGSLKAQGTGSAQRISLVGASLSTCNALTGRTCLPACHETHTNTDKAGCPGCSTWQPPRSHKPWPAQHSCWPAPAPHQGERDAHPAPHPQHAHAGVASSMVAAAAPCLRLCRASTKLTSVTAMSKRVSTMGPLWSS